MAKGIKVHHISDKELQRMKKKWTRNCMRAWEILSMLSLRDEFGFEAIDLIKFIKRLNVAADDVAAGRIHTKDAIEVLTEETGMKYENDTFSIGDEYMKENLQTTTEIVKKVLTEYPATRNNDRLLYYRVCEIINDKTLTSNFGYVLLHQKDFEIPSIETVGRCRRKAQEKHPELRASKEVEEKRAERETEFREYAKG